MNDSELLQYIRKLIEEKSETLQGRSSWQEHLDRHTTVSAKSIQASEIIRGFSGSWASIYSAFPSDERLEKIADQRTPPNPSREYTKIGQSGVSEINFAPYDHNTNRQGMKGTSLLGHPISFEVIGTTVKSSACDWQFIAEDNSSTPLSGDTIRIDTESSLLSPVGVVAPVAADMVRCYGMDAVDPIPSSGMYLIVSHTGEPPPLIDGTNPSGLGDGFIANFGVAPTFDPTKPRMSVSAKDQYSKYEVFRVVAINPDVPGGLITLDPSKRLKDYFNFDGAKSNIIRAVTFITPKATRLATVPQSGETVGRERAFVVVPPEKSSVNDLTPPLNGQTVGDGTWQQGGFDPNDPTLTGNTSYYVDSNNLPIPRVLGKYIATLEKATQGLSKSANVSRLFGTFGTEVKTGQVIHIFKKEIEFALDIPLTTDPFGWYEILDSNPSNLLIKKLTEVNTETGVKNFQPIIVQDDLDPSYTDKTYTVHFHLHDPISTLHSNHFDIDAVEHARLDNLIDPTWVAESGKNQESGQNTLYSKSDKAVFNTQSTNDGASGTNADPGSLLDLGFRMVLFPAKSIAGQLVADFDKPITSRESILDITIEDQEQSIHIDYSSGVVLLSHSPKWKTSLGMAVTYHDNDINPNFVTDSFGRIVLFASCVPYSRELGQLGSAVRVTASTVDFTNDLEEQNDIYGKRISFDIQAGQTVNSQLYNSQLILSSLDSENRLPESGYVEILHSATTTAKSNQPAFTVLDGGGVTRRVSTFIYHSKSTITSGGIVYTTLLGVVGGGVGGTSITSTVDGEYKVVLRKNVRSMCDDKGVCGVSYQEDTTYGSAKRFDTIRFKNSEIVQNKDGSVTIDVGVTPTEETTEEDVLGLEGEYVLLPKGATGGNGTGESRYFGDTDAEIHNLGDYPTDTPLYEFSGGYGKGYLHKGYPIKPSGYFNLRGQTFAIPPTADNYWIDTTFATGTSITTDMLPFNGTVTSGNLSVGYRHINSRESHLYSSMRRQIEINNSVHPTHYKYSSVRQMRVLDGMVIEDVTNGTFYNVGSKGMNSTWGFVTKITVTLDTTATISDGDTFYVSISSVTKEEFIFRNTPTPSSNEVLVGATALQSIANLLLVVNNNAFSNTNGITLDLETYLDTILLHTYHSANAGLGPTTVTGYGNVYDHPTDFRGYYGVGGSIVGDGASTAPLVQNDVVGENTLTDNNLKTLFSLSKKTPNFLISSGDRSSLFWTFYDDTKAKNLNSKDDLFIGFLNLDNSSVDVIQVTHTPGADLKSSLENVVNAVNSLTNADYLAAGFNTSLWNGARWGGVEARLCHIEEGTVFNRYAIEFRAETIGNLGNRWFITDSSNLGNNDGIVSLVTKTFSHPETCNVASTVWTTYSQVGGGSYQQHTVASAGSDAWFFEGGGEQEINFDTNDCFNLERLPNQSGLGDRTDDNVPRKPLAGHHYRVVPNVEFVRVLGTKGVNGGLIPPYTNPSDPTSIITNAHAIFFDTRYNFQGSDVGRKIYLSGTETFAYVGWWEILGILPNYTIPQNIDETTPITVAIVKKMGVETRGSSNDEKMYNWTITSQRGQLPLTYRSPIVRMGFDTYTNGQGGVENFEPYGFFKYWDKVTPADASYSDLVVTIQMAVNGTANKVQQFIAYKNDLATGTLFGLAANPSYVVDTATQLVEFCNQDQRMNGQRFIFSDGSTGIAFIKWIVEYDSEYPSGSAVYVTYNLQALNQTQIDSLLGLDGILQINFLSRQDNLFFKDDPAVFGPPIGVNDATAIGFISHKGHNSEFDTCLGDRNSAFIINPFEIIDPASNPFGVPSADVTKRSASACNGLRWVFSEPLEDRHNGSYAHLNKENQFIFSGYNWHHHKGIVNTASEHPVINYQDTYRINKCPSSNQFLLGGDVEVFHTEVNGILNSDYSATEPIYRHPIAYSSLGVVGVWNDTETGTTPVTGSRNYNPTYKLQLINKERIVTISPTSMASNTLLGSMTDTNAVGTGGLGTRIINTTTPQMTLGAESPFKLFSKSNIQRSNIWGVDAIGGSLGTPDDTRSERELWNSDNIFGNDLMRNPKEIPHYYFSLYSWSPNNTWWQLQLPVIQENDQINASTPPPTLRVDLTEQFTQSSTSGNGNNLSDGSTNAKGVRLNKLWVNFGLWGDASDYLNNVLNSVAGAPMSVVGATVTKPTPDESEMMKRNHISFNLVLEIPSPQKKRFNLEKRRGVITVISPIGGINIGDPLINITIGTPSTLNVNLIAVSRTSAVGVAQPINDYEVIVGEYVFGGGVWVWTPLDEQQLARAISDSINIIYKNADLTPSAETGTVQSQAIYNKIYWEAPSDERVLVTPYATTGSLETRLFSPSNSSIFTNSGSDNLLFGDRSGTATASHMMNIGSVEPMKTIVVPLYVNREAGELMPNTMEQQVDIGVGKYNTFGASISSDWNNGDPTYGFGYSDYSNLNYLNLLAYTDNVTVSLYQRHITNDYYFSKYSLVGNPSVPVVWGGVDFDSANNNFIQASTNNFEDSSLLSFASVKGDTYNGWNGDFTSPFSYTANSLVQASQHPRLSRMGGGLRGEYSTGNYVNGDLFARRGDRYPYEGPASHNSNAMTGIVIAHDAIYPISPISKEGSPLSTLLVTPTIGTETVKRRNSMSCSHSFTVALTPMAQKMDMVTDSRGRRSSVGTLLHSRFNTQISERLSDFGRFLDPTNDQNQVGNWLGEILSWSGVENTDGSTLPQGARVYLEIGTNLGDVEGGLSNNGVWVGSVKCSFDVESDYGTTQTKIIKEE